jgi:hypothetical protein
VFACVFSCVCTSYVARFAGSDTTQAL